MWMVSFNVTMQQSPSLFSHFQVWPISRPAPPSHWLRQPLPLGKDKTCTVFLIAVSECTIYRLCLFFLSAVPNRFKYRHNACFRDIDFKMFFEVTIVSNTVRVHALSCLQNCLCSSKISFQIASESTILASLISKS